VARDQVAIVEARLADIDSGKVKLLTLDERPASRLTKPFGGAAQRPKTWR